MHQRREKKNSFSSPSWYKNDRQSHSHIDNCILIKIGLFTPSVSVCLTALKRYPCCSIIVLVHNWLYRSQTNSGSISFEQYIIGNRAPCQILELNSNNKVLDVCQIGELIQIMAYFLGNIWTRPIEDLSRLLNIFDYTNTIVVQQLHVRIRFVRLVPISNEVRQLIYGDTIHTRYLWSIALKQLRGSSVQCYFWQRNLYPTHLTPLLRPTLWDLLFLIEAVKKFHRSWALTLPLSVADELLTLCNVM